jgi:eukaryotic-like serine/threonine-protein kinase
LQQIIYSAIERDPKNRYAHAREFSQDLRHQDQVGVADRRELKGWRERKSEWPRRILNCAALALIPIVIFSLLLWGGETGLIWAILGTNLPSTCVPAF